MLNQASLTLSCTCSRSTSRLLPVVESTCRSACLWQPNRPVVYHNVSNAQLHSVSQSWLVWLAFSGDASPSFVKMSIARVCDCIELDTAFHAIDRRVKGWSCSDTGRATATQLSPWKMSFKVTITFLPIFLSSILGSFTNRESLSKTNFSQTTKPTSPSNVEPGLNTVTLNGRGRTGVNASTTGSAAQDQKQCSHPAEAGFEKGMDGYTTDNSSGNVKWEIWPKAGNQHWPRISRFISPPPFSGELSISLEPARTSRSTCHVLFVHSSCTLIIKLYGQSFQGSNCVDLTADPIPDIHMKEGQTLSTCPHNRKKHHSLKLVKTLSGWQFAVQGKS